MEADPYYIKPEILRFSQKAGYCNEGGSKFESKTAQTLRIIREDAQDEFRSWAEPRNLIQFIYIVEGHGIDTLLRSAPNVGYCLAGVGENDPRRTDIKGENLCDFAIGSTIKAGAECR
jgi:hypothetical protein